MAGTFAHMILVRTLCRPETLDGISALTTPMKRAMMMLAAPAGCHRGVQGTGRALDAFATFLMATAI